MRATSPRLLSPPIDDKPIYPYARVWRAVLFVSGGTLVAALILWLLERLGLSIPPALYLPLDIALILLPVVLWAIFSIFAERRALEPRVGLITTAAVAALVANGATLPFIDLLFQPARWLPNADLVTRIIGYTVSIGMAQELSKYLVVRAVAWENKLRVRMDTIAFSLAAAVGYTAAANLIGTFASPASPTATAFTIATNLALNLASSLLVAYGLAEARFSNASAFLLPIVFALAALLFGVATALGTNLSNASLTLTPEAQISAPQPIFGLAVAAALVTVIGLAVAFLIANSERREAEARAGE